MQSPLLQFLRAFLLLLPLALTVNACLEHDHNVETRSPQRLGGGSPSSSLVVKPNHTGFTVSSIAEAVKFWNGVLGLNILYRYNSTGPPISTLVGIPSANLNIAFINLPGGLQVELLEYPNVEALGRERKLLKPDSDTTGMVHLALDVKPGSLDGILLKAAAVGWNMVNTGGEVVTLVDGRRAVYLRDGRDGFTVELFEGR